MTNDLVIRTATTNDAKLLFEWRNDNETRRQSRMAEPVEWGSHVRWVESSLMDTNRILCVAEFDSIPFGTLRADLRDDGFTEISYTVAPAFRGKGLSKPMVLQFVREFLKGRKIAADIKKGHVPSESIAKALRLSPHHETPSENPDDPRSMVEWR